MDRFLNVIVAGNVSPKTRETLLKQLDQEIAITPPAVAPEMARGGDDAAEGMAGEMPGGPEGRQRGGRQLARMEANITDPVTKVVGLLGSPEFQRQ